jgi:hypothetical protein
LIRRNQKRICIYLLTTAKQRKNDKTHVRYRKEDLDCERYYERRGKRGLAGPDRAISREISV